MTSEGRRSFRSACLVALLLSPVGCSKDEPSNTSYGAALKSVWSSMHGPTATWATAVASASDQELTAKGTVDPNRLLEVATTQAGPVNETACTAVAKTKALYRTEQNSADARRQLGEFVDRELVAAFGKVPLVLFDFKVDWPPSWLSDRSKPPQYAGPAKAADPQYLKAVLVQRLVSPEGFFLTPEPNGPDYGNLIDWLRSSGLPFPNRIVALTEPINSGIFECVSQAVRAK